MYVYVYQCMYHYASTIYIYISLSLSLFLYLCISMSLSLYIYIYIYTYILYTHFCWEFLLQAAFATAWRAARQRALGDEALVSMVAHRSRVIATSAQRDLHIWRRSLAEKTALGESTKLARQTHEKKPEISATACNRNGRVCCPGIVWTQYFEVKVGRAMCSKVPGRYQSLCLLELLCSSRCTQFGPELGCSFLWRFLPKWPYIDQWVSACCSMMFEAIEVVW